MPSIDKAKAKHQTLVTGLARMQDKRLKMIAALTRNEKRIDKQTRAIARSSKRIDKLVNGKVATITHNGAYTTPELVEANVSKPPAGDGKLNDPVPSFGKTEPVSGEHQPDTGPTPATPTVDAEEQQPKPKRRARRTPDDFRAEMEKRKLINDSAK